MNAAATSRTEVVVGIDGSPCSKTALLWAGDYAAQTDGLLTLVIAWQWPMSYGSLLASEGFDPKEDARKVVEAARADVDLPDDRVQTVIANGHAGDVLVRVSRDAALLVLGTRGHGGLVVGALLGSTSAYCVHHAHCPVLVVR